MDEFVEHDFLCHYGILGMKWGIRRYQNPDGSLTPAGRKHYGGSERDRDITIHRGTKLQTLSVDKNRTKDAEFFYAAFTKNDKEWYKDIFSRSSETVVPILNIPKMKYSITNKTINNVKVASMKSGEDVMSKLYDSDTDFKDFVNNPERLQNYMRKDYDKEVYNEALSTLKKINERGSATNEEIREVYKLWNYVIPNDGTQYGGDANDIATQRKKFFDALKDAGYGAVLDTNDAYYGNYGDYVETPVIVFDRDAIIPSSVRKVRYSEVVAGIGRYAVKKTTHKITNKTV